MTSSCGYDTISSVVLLIQLKCTSKSEIFILNYDLPVFWLGRLLKGKAEQLHHYQTTPRVHLASNV